MIKTIILGVFCIYCVSSIYVKNGHFGSSDCPCSDATYCNRITAPDRKEVFAYAVNLTFYKRFDWNKLTTVVVYESGLKQVGVDIVCYAHKYGARVLIATSISKEDLLNATSRAKNIQYYYSITEKYYMDGANIDIEMSTAASDLRDSFTDYVKETKEKYSATYPHSLVVTDVFWLPNIYHDTYGLAKYSDFLFIMAYDEQSAMLPPCVARANAPLYQTELGVHAFRLMGIQSHKLVLGVPWYGYEYNCVGLFYDRFCSINKTEGKCTQAVGSEISYSTIRQKLPHSISGEQWSEEYSSPYSNFKVSTGFQQIWYDNAKSLKLKYNMAERLELRGVGMWTADSLNYANASDPTTREMWDALPAYKNQVSIYA